MANDRIQYLLIRFFNGECTDPEREELALWIDALKNEDEWEVRLKQIWDQYQSKEKPEPARADEIIEKILAEKEEFRRDKAVPLPHSAPYSGMMRIAVAAAAVVGILIVLSLVFLVPKPLNNPKSANRETLQKQLIVPGGNKAVLTLANGEKIALDNTDNGLLASKQTGNIIKLSDGLLKYEKVQSLKLQGQKQTEYNIISTPRGGQYRIILPDGSKVWLNAASSLKFPTAFTGKERIVQMTGEAYFEVAKDASRPFLVKKGNMEIRVLGTHFNVMAYDNKAGMKVTLLEGLVKVSQDIAADPSVSSPYHSQLVKPGEQALVSKNGIDIRKEVNLNEVIAWKNGLFDFEGNDIQQVMQQIARWYDVKVKYENVSSAHFMGTIPRSTDVSEVLKMLEMTGAVHFKVEGRTIMVTR